MAAISALLVPTVAFAHDFKHFGAPEPFTVVGLGVGAAAIGAARWYSRRKASPKGDDR